MAVDVKKLFNEDLKAALVRHSADARKIGGKYHVRLIQDKRSERVPSGLLVAEYREEQMVGEKDIGLLQESGLLDH